MIDLTPHRYVITFAGESGQGINSIGEVIAKTLKHEGYHIYGSREYPSLIKGGFSSYQLDISDKEVSAPSSHCDFLLCISRVSVQKYLRRLRPYGKLIHSLAQMQFSPDEQAFLDEHYIQVEYVNAMHMAVEHGGKSIMSNVILLGLTWRMLGLGFEPLAEAVKEQFKKKPALLDANMRCLEAGFQYATETVTATKLPFAPDPNWGSSLLVPGNESTALGVISAGVRMYCGYPMTPATPILDYLARVYHKTGMLVKQAEDEITAAQMALGAMAMGTRALTATSGGGFDLMTETVSLAGMIETPFVCILGQRPGPATGLPTWTAAADLNLAVYGGHGEFPRCVMAMSDAHSTYRLVQEAFNIAEKYQMPVILLTEKQIGESLFNVDALDDVVPIVRTIVEGKDLEALKPTDRYKDTSTGISLRWLPGTADATYDLNSDEHLADGTLTEDAEPTRKSIEKRMRKLQTLFEELAEPVLYGDPDASTTLVGWGSPKNTVLDAISLGAKINYLHYEYLHPLKTEKFLEIVKTARRVVLIENNYLGQLGALITQATGYMFTEKLLKYDGRPFYIEDVMEYR